MKLLHWKIQLGLALIAASAGLYGLNYLIYRDVNYMGRLFLAQLGFLPVSVLLVTIILNQLMTQRARAGKLAKLNMVIGAFFSEVGTELLGRLAVADSALDEVRDQLVPTAKWQPADYAMAGKAAQTHSATIDLSSCDLNELKAMLVREKPFLLGLLGNQALLEHESFTELLWAVTHLAEELDARADFEDLPAADRIHLAGDVKRAFTLLTGQWLEYVRHLQLAYPYLFSLAVRLNPLDPSASVTVKE